MTNHSHLLNWILWMPFLGVLGTLFIPKAKEEIVRWWALTNTGITLLLSLILYSKFDPSVPGMQETFNVKIPWISQFNIFYSLGVDGISLPMVLLSGLLFFLCILSSWTITKSVKTYFALFLLLQNTVLGVFLALDFFLFYVYWRSCLSRCFFSLVFGAEKIGNMRPSNFFSTLFLALSSCS